MPRPRHAMGRPGTSVIPADWQTTQAATLARTLDCTVAIGAPGTTPTWDPVAKTTLSQPVAPAYSGPATITPVAQDSDRQTETAEDVVPLGGYEVKILHATAAVEVGHFVTISAAPDPMLTGRRLLVTGIEMGSRRFSRILHAVDAD